MVALKTAFVFLRFGLRFVNCRLSLYAVLFFPLVVSSTQQLIFFREK